MNLIGNAIKFTTSGTVSVRAVAVGTVDLEAVTDAAGKKLLQDPRGTWVALQVADTGVGIATSDLERIFDDFEQVNAGPRADSERRGTGLGLTISRRLARLLGGEISVTSEVGRGSVFTMWMPVDAVPRA